MKWSYEVKFQHPYRLLFQTFIAKRLKILGVTLENAPDKWDLHFEDCIYYE